MKTNVILNIIVIGKLTEVFEQMYDLLGYIGCSTIKSYEILEIVLKGLIKKNSISKTKCDILMHKSVVNRINKYFLNQDPQKKLDKITLELRVQGKTNVKKILLALGIID